MSAPEPGSPIDPQQIEKAFHDFEAVAGPTGLMPTPAAAAGFEPCANWRSIKPTVSEVIVALRALGGIFPLAKRAADIVQTLATLLDQVCGA